MTQLYLRMHPKLSAAMQGHMGQQVINTHQPPLPSPCISTADTCRGREGSKAYAFKTPPPSLPQQLSKAQVEAWLCLSTHKPAQLSHHRDEG